MNNPAEITRITDPAMKLTMPPPAAEVPNIVKPSKNQKSAHPDALVVPFIETSLSKCQILYLSDFCMHHACTTTVPVESLEHQLALDNRLPFELKQKG